MATRLKPPGRVIGVGMHRSTTRLWPESKADIAGSAALGDAGVAFKESAALRTAIFAAAMTGGVAIARSSVTGLPVTRVENASATGGPRPVRPSTPSEVGGSTSRWARLRQDEPDHRLQAVASVGRIGARTSCCRLRSSRCGRRDACTTSERPSTRSPRSPPRTGTTHGSNPMAQRQADHEVAPDKVLASTMISYPHTSMMACQPEAALQRPSSPRARWPSGSLEGARW